MMWALFLGEVSNPFNLMRQVLDADDRPKESLRYGIVFMIVFFGVRFVIGPILSFWLCASPYTPLLMKITCGLMSNLRILTQFGSDIFGAGES